MTIIAKKVNDRITIHQQIKFKSIKSKTAQHMGTDRCPTWISQDIMNQLKTRSPALASL